MLHSCMLVFERFKTRLGIFKKEKFKILEETLKVPRAFVAFERQVGTKRLTRSGKKED